MDDGPRARQFLDFAESSAPTAENAEGMGGQQAQLLGTVEEASRMQPKFTYVDPVPKKALMWLCASIQAIPRTMKGYLELQIRLPMYEFVSLHAYTCMHEPFCSKQMSYVLDIDTSEEIANLEKYIETALGKMSKTHDLIGRLEDCMKKDDPNCRARKSPVN